ncbi:MAG: MBL fold metallo-hydrolase [Promethearchaeota archaeon]|jgi:glyoxylase-like metal-dependent hydrolase (beta-lactamase superfamily II)
MIELKDIVKDVYVVKSYDPNDIDCCVYLVDTKSDDGLILIDAGINFEPIQDIESHGFKLKDIKHCLITHGHLDHYGICYKLREFSKDIKFYAHKLDAEKIEEKSVEPSPNPILAKFKYESVKLAKKISHNNEILEFGTLKFQCIHIPGHTPGSIAYLLVKEGKTILFAGDVPGVAINFNDGNNDNYVKSMKKLLTFHIDILCEGHEEIIKPAEKVSNNIRDYMNFNKTLNNLIFEDPTDKNVVLDLIKISYDLEWYDMVLDSCNYLLEIEPDNIEAKQMVKKMKSHKPPETGFLKRLISQVYGRE